MAVRELADDIISEGVVHVIDGNPGLLGVRQSAFPDLPECFGVLAGLVEENHEIKPLCKAHYAIGR